jgi:hypothetical protein
VELVDQAALQSSFRAVQSAFALLTLRTHEDTSIRDNRNKNMRNSTQMKLLEKEI